jgi:DNA-binding Xre family transcriptional regulator
MQPFGLWIKERRVKKMIGLWRCAGYAGIGGEALRLIETGKTNPAHCKASTLYGLARILELNTADVLERAVREDEEFMTSVHSGQDWKARESGDAKACYLRYLAKLNRL